MPTSTNSIRGILNNIKSSYYNRKPSPTEIERQLNHLAKKIRTSFPKLPTNLCALVQHTQNLFVESGLREAAQHAIKDIEKEMGEKLSKIAISPPTHLVKLSPNKYINYAYEYLNRIIAEINRYSNLYEGIKGEDRIFSLWIKKIAFDKQTDVKTVLEECRNINNWSEFNAEFEKRALKNILSHCSFFMSQPTAINWKEKVKQISEAINYFRQECKIPEMEIYFEEINKILTAMEESNNLNEAVNQIKCIPLKYFSDFLQLVKIISENIDSSRKTMEEAFAAEREKGRELNLLSLILLKENIEINDVQHFCDFLMHHASQKFLREKTRLPLNSSNKYIRGMFKYFYEYLRYILDTALYQSIAGRSAYALREREAQEIIFEKLNIQKDDRFLDMFANIPVTSWFASLLGAKVCSVDCAFVKDGFSINHEYYLGTGLVQLLDWLRHVFTLPAESVIGPEMVKPENVEELFLSSYLAEIIRNNPPEYLTHWYDLKENVFLSIELNDNSFDKAVIDPPYGKETATKGFGPKEGFKIGKDGLQDTHRLLKKGGKVVLTLPSYRQPDWNEFIKMGWRENILNFAKKIGFQQINNDKSLSQGRALALLEKL